MNIGENISTLRRERGITQEQLGQMIGVSAQAVSKWENGGTPDIALLPMLAEKFGVTIDTLFGTEKRSRENMAVTIRQWLLSLPTDRRIPELFSALSGSFRSLLHDVGSLTDAGDHFPMETAYITVDGHEIYYRSLIDAECGQALGVLAKDFPMYMLLPRPEGGYVRNLAGTEDYQKLFACLASPGVMELLLCIHRHRDTGYSAGALSRLSGMPVDSAAIQSLLDMHLIRENTVELESGTEKLYRFEDVGAFIPLLYVARWFMETQDQWWNTCSHYRSTPLLAD